MRITNSMVMASTLNDIGRSLSRLQESQTELSTGRVIRRPSDDPTGASSAMNVRTSLRQLEQHRRAQTDAQGWIATADTAVQSATDALQRIKELAVRAANDGAITPAARTAYTTEVAQLRDELLTLSNTTYLGRSIFNGTAAGPAYDDTGTYVGDNAAVTRTLAPNTSMQVNVTGPDVFGDPAAPEGDLFAVLNRLEIAIGTGNTAGIADEHANIDVARERMTSTLAGIGSRGARLESVTARTADDEIVLRETLAELEDADIAETLISVKSNEMAYTAALQAAAKILPPSLLDYMR